MVRISDKPQENGLELEFSTYGDPWMDNAAQNFARMVREIHSSNSSIPRPTVEADMIHVRIPDIADFSSALKEQILRDRKRYVTYIGTTRSGEKFRKAHNHILIQIRGKLSVQNPDDDSAIKEKMWRSDYIEEILQEMLFIQKKSGNAKNRCIFCGDKFHKKFDNLKQAVYPFITKIRSVTGVRKRREYYNRHVCPKCHIIGVYEWGDPGIVYTRLAGKGGDNTLVLLPQMQSLSELDTFKSRYIPQIIDRDWRSNLVFRIGKSTSRPNSREGVVIAFLEKYFRSETYRQLDPSDFLSFDTTKLFRFASILVPHGQVKNLRYSYITTIPHLVDIIKRMSDDTDVEDETPLYQGLVLGTARRKANGKTDWELTQTARERITRGIFTFKLRELVAATMPSSRSILSLRKEAYAALRRLLTNEWRYKEMMSKTELETIKKAGSVVATIFSVTKSPAYFKLDRARTLQEMLSALRQLSKKLSKENVSTFPVPLSEAITVLNEHPDSWREIRDVMLIFSNVFYAIDRYKKTKEGEPSE